MENSCKHLVVILKDITFNQTRVLLDYMYHGEVSVEEEELHALLDVAKALKVKGLVKDEDNGAVVPTSKKSSDTLPSPGMVKMTSPNRKDDIFAAIEDVKSGK